LGFEKRISGAGQRSQWRPTGRNWGNCPRSDSFFHPRYNDIHPQLSIAWSHGNTVLRAGGGIYHTDGQEDDQNLPISNTVQRYSSPNTSFPTLSDPLTRFLNYAENGGLGVVSPRDLDRNRKDDYAAAWTAPVQIRGYGAAMSIY
jgi:hypothetical protein